MCSWNIYRVVAGTIYDILGNTVSSAAQRRRDMLLSEGNTLADAWGAPPVVRAFVGGSDAAALGCEASQREALGANTDADMILLLEQVINDQISSCKCSVIHFL